MNKSFEVSVVIPVYNSGEALACCLQALCRQKTNKVFEVVVVDDGSTENLEPIRNTFRNRLIMQWLRLPENHGPAAARNKGIYAARGKIVLFTDADCQPEENWLEKLTQPFENPEVRGVKGVYKSSQKDIWARLAQLEFEERYEYLKTHSDIDFIDTYCGGYRREDLIKVEGFDESFPKADNEDVDLSFRVKKLGGKFVFVPDAVVWHKHREGFWNYVKLKFGRGYWRMRVYRKHPSKAGKDSYTPWTLKAQMMLLLLLPLGICTKRNFKRWLLAWLITCIPQIKITLKKDFLLFPIIPFFHFVRGIALLAGIIQETTDFNR